MFEPNTVFVVGAGASAEFGLPVGTALLQTIKESSQFQFDHGIFPSKGNRLIFKAVSDKYLGDNRALNLAFQTFADIRLGVETAGSIDEYINRYSDDSMIAELGKVLIAHSILEAEGKSKLMPSSGRDVDGVEWQSTADTWIATFVRALFDGVRATELEKIGEGITIICFNYDRCIEFYLEHAIMRAYRGVDRDVARKIVSNISIIHPYGWLGDLGQLPFGAPLDRIKLYEVSDSLVTWSESVDDRKDQLEIMRGKIAAARNLVFLGFAFASQNLKLLDPSLSEKAANVVNVYATGYGLSADVESKLKGKILRMYRRNASDYAANFVTIKYDMVCSKFINAQLLNLTL